MRYLYRAPSGFVNLDSMRQSTIEALRFKRRGPSPRVKNDEKDRFRHAAASHSQNLMERGIIALFASLCVLVTPLIGMEISEGKTTLSEVLNHKIQPPLFADGKEVVMPAETILRIAEPILKNRLVAMNYDRMFPILQFLDHYDACKTSNPDISPIEAFKTFTFAPLVSREHGGPCVSLTLDLYDHLPSSLNAYIIAAKLPGRFQQLAFPEFCHTAILIKFLDPISNDRGYVLLDPSFDICRPILLKEGGAPFMYDLGEKGMWEFYIDGEHIRCTIHSKESEQAKSRPGFFEMTYLTRTLLNPVESSAVPMILSDRRYSLLARREDGSHIVHMNIEMNKSRIIWDQGSIKCAPIPFTTFLDHRWTFPTSVSEALHIEESVLSARILRILKNRDVLDSLYHSYLKCIKETDDFTITGELNLNQIDDILGK